MARTCAGGPDNDPPPCNMCEGARRDIKLACGLEWSGPVGQSIVGQMTRPGDAAPVPVRLDTLVSVSDIL